MLDDFERAIEEDSPGWREPGMIGYRAPGVPAGEKPALKKVRYTHDAMIDEIIARPEVSQGELARLFGFSEGWVSIVINGDAFKERLSERKASLIDPKITASIEDRLGGLAKIALDKLIARIDSSQPISNTDLISAARLGVGDRNLSRAQVPTNQNLYVVNIPPPGRDSKTWLQESSRGLPMVEEVSTRGLMDPGDGA